MAKPKVAAQPPARGRINELAREADAMHQGHADALANGCRQVDVTMRLHRAVERATGTLRDFGAWPEQANLLAEIPPAAKAAGRANLLGRIVARFTGDGSPHRKLAAEVLTLAGTGDVAGIKEALAAAKAGGWQWQLLQALSALGERLLTLEADESRPEVLRNGEPRLVPEAADEQRQIERLIDQLKEIETWGNAWTSIVDDIGGWRGHEAERPGAENAGSGWYDPAVRLLPVFGGTHSDSVRSGLAMATENVIRIVTRRGRADITAIQALNEAAIKWCCERKSEGLPEQAELERLLDCARTLLSPLHDAIHGEIVAIQTAATRANVSAAAMAPVVAPNLRRPVQISGDGKCTGDDWSIQLEENETATIVALAERGAASLQQLRNASDIDDVARVLKRVLKKHPQLAGLITLPGARGRGGYRTMIVIAPQSATIG